MYYFFLIYRMRLILNYHQPVLFRNPQACLEDRDLRVTMNSLMSRMEAT